MSIATHWHVGKVLWLREWMRVRPDLKDQFINYFLVWPFMISFTSGFLAPLTYFGNDPKRATMLFSGMLLLKILIVAFVNAVVVLRERTLNPVLPYQVTTASLPLVFGVRFLFGSLYTAFWLLPFLPVSKLILGNGLYTDEISWFGVSLVVVLGSMLAMAYGLFLSTMLTNMGRARILWERFIQPALWMGGMWVPFFCFYTLSPWFGYFALCNPFIYVTEAIRHLIFPTGPYLSVPICISAIFVATLGFAMISYYRLRRCIDSV